MRAVVILAAFGLAAPALAQPAAEIRLPGVTIQFTAAPRISLFDERLDRADSNSPVHVHEGRAYAFVSHWQPAGHFFRRVGGIGLRFDTPLQPTRLLNDPDPTAGKWLEATWRDASGRLYGWYHAEEVAPCPRDLRLPHVGAMASDDDGLSWRVIGPVLRAADGTHDCEYRNGFFAGGLGDPSVVPDRAGRWFYIHYASYVPDETAQGIAVARYPVARRDAPAGAVEVWTGAGWAPAAQAAARPFWPQTRGWRHPDPTGYWGPAVHYNRALEQFVMLLNRTEGARADWRQEGIYVSFNPDPADPARWSEPARIVAGGGWYPQAIGTGPADGDTEAGASARFFMSGQSEWEIRVARTAPQAGGARMLRGAQAGPDTTLRLPAAEGRRGPARD